MDNDGRTEHSSPYLDPTQPALPPNVKVVQVDLPKRSVTTRPGFGTCGQSISLCANYFKASIRNPDEMFYQYSVKYSNTLLFFSSVPYSTFVRKSILIAGCY